MKFNVVSKEDVRNFKSRLEYVLYDNEGLYRIVLKIRHQDTKEVIGSFNIYYNTLDGSYSAVYMNNDNEVLLPTYYCSELLQQSYTRNFILSSFRSEDTEKKLVKEYLRKNS